MMSPAQHYATACELLEAHTKAGEMAAKVITHVDAERLSS